MYGRLRVGYCKGKGVYKVKRKYSKGKEKLGCFIGRYLNEVRK